MLNLLATIRYKDKKPYDNKLSGLWLDQNGSIYQQWYIANFLNCWKALRVNILQREIEKSVRDSLKKY